MPPNHVLMTASHCHGRVCANVADRTLEAVRRAAARLVPARIGVGLGYEDRIQHDRGITLDDGSLWDQRHVYSMPPEERVAAVADNFACHPIQGVPSGRNGADITGFASCTIEENLDPGMIALFLQGCAGNISPGFYKDVARPRDADPLGMMLELSTPKALRQIQTKRDGRPVAISATNKLPPADWSGRIKRLEAERDRLVHAFR